MGCEQSTPVDEGGPSNQRQLRNLHGVGQTERQIGKMQRAAMNNTGPASSDGGCKPTAPKLDEQGFLAPEEVAKRTFSSICNREVTLGTMSNVTHCQYAHWTQRGYYPDDPHKQNQDEFGAHLEFAGVQRDAMFAVYDGHGKQGHSCSQFAKERLPKAIAKHVRRVRCHNYQQSRDPAQGKKGAWDPSKWPMLTRQEYEGCCKKAFLEVNQAMHDAPDVVDSLSGTTATTVNFHGNFVSVSNVGDSRVVLGHRVKRVGDAGISIHYPTSAGFNSGEEEKDDMEYSGVATPVVKPGGTFDRRRTEAPGTTALAIPLSKDQTPFRKDERERVKKLGARVMSIDQMQGKEEVHEDWGDMVLGETLDFEGDSPRVWAQGRDYPGCAFTRSLGDAMSESIGITAMPEILSTELTINDEFLVVASDGIFEFLTNQAVIDMCAASESPLMACEKIVKASYEQWLTYENRTDDITVIVCFLQNFKSPQRGCKEGTTEDLIQTLPKIYGTKSSRMSTQNEETGNNSEAFAYVSPEARATIIQPSTPTSRPPPVMTFDGDDDESISEEEEELLSAILRANTPPPVVFDNTEVLEKKIDDSLTSKTASVTTASDNVSDHLFEAQGSNKHGITTFHHDDEMRDSIQV